MAIRTAGIPALFLIFALTLGLGAQTQSPPEPLRPRLLDARTAWVVNDGASTGDFQQFSNALKRWNRYRFVDTLKEADLLILLSTTGPANQPAAHFLPQKAAGKLWIKVLNSESDDLLWSESGDSPRRLVSRFKDRVEKEEERRRQNPRPPVSPVG